MTTALAKKDINGYPRHYEFTDMGCYEDPHLIGFRLRWGSERVYISSRSGTVNQIPLMLPENEINQIGVDWTVTVQSVVIPNTWSISPTPPITGSGTGVVVGMLNITTTTTYTAGAERHVGTLLVQSNLGGYLADTELEIWQVPGTSALWENGYVGSFHRNHETSERYITGENSYAVFVSTPGSVTTQTTKSYYKYWSARIVSGMDWIKIDTNPKGYNGGNIVETYGGVVSGETPTDGDAIRFRVGLKSTLPLGAPPRYGLIIISRGNDPNLAAGATWFFVRQGEEADYLFRPTNVPGVTPDPRTAGFGNRDNAKKYLPFNLSAPSTIPMVNGGVDVRPSPTNPSTAVTVSHPTKIGDFFQRNRTIAYRRGVQTTSLPNNYLTAATVWVPGQDVCPSGYRHPSWAELYESLYQNAPNVQNSYSGNDVEALRGFLWGYYADGYFDQLAPDPVPVINPGTIFLGTQPNVASKGILLVNHANFASVFFPLAGTMAPTSVGAVGQNYGIENPRISATEYVPSLYVLSNPVAVGGGGGSYTNGPTGFYPTTFWNAGVNIQSSGTAHWVGGHIGLSCTSLTAYSGTNIRCIKDE